MTRVKGPFGMFFLVVVLLIATDLSSKTIDGFSIGAEKETIQMDKRSHHGLTRIAGGQVVKYGEESTWTVRKVTATSFFAYHYPHESIYRKTLSIRRVL